MSPRDIALEHLWQLIRRDMSFKEAYSKTIHDLKLSPIEANILRSRYYGK